MVGGGDDHQGVIHEGLGHQVQPLRGRSHECQVDSVLAEVLQQGFAVDHVEAELHVRVQGTEQGHQPGGEDAGGTGRRHREGAALQALQVGEGLFQVGELARDGLAAAQRFPPRLGQPDLLADVLEQRQPQSRLQLFDLHGDRGLGEVQLGTGAGKAATTGHGFENLELAQGELQHQTNFEAA